MSSNISMKRAHLGLEVGSSSIEKQGDKEIEDGSFICHSCEKEIAKGRDHLATPVMVRLGNEIVGLFRNVLNVVRDPEQAPDPGHGDFNEDVLCSECMTRLGGLIVRVNEPHALGDFFVAGNYFMIMNKLLVRNGNMLLDAATRRVVRYL